MDSTYNIVLSTSESTVVMFSLYLDMVDCIEDFELVQCSFLSPYMNPQNSES